MFKLPTRDSATGRAIATAIQVGVAAVGILPVVAAILGDPRFVGLIHDYLPQLTGIISAASGSVTLVNNLLRKNVRNY